MAKNNQKEIKELLTQLEKAADRGKKQKIRAELRSLGHKGGLNKPKGKKVKKAKKKKA